MDFKALGVTTITAMIPAILAWLLVVALDAIKATPVAGSHHLITLGAGRGSGLFRRAISGVEIGRKGGEHGQKR
jgi:hypothetical protein